MKTEKGQALTPSALTGIRAAIHRHLTCAPLSRNINILQDSEFMSANKMFEAKAKLFTKENNAKPKHKSSIQSGDMQKLNRYFMEGQNTDGVWKDAEKLVEFIWFSLCFHFARRGREGWRELTRQSFEIKTDDTGARYITEKLTEQTKNSILDQSEQSYSDVRMYETSTALDPVAAFEFYLSKTHPYQQDDGKDFRQSRVIGAVHESLHSCIDCHFFVPARCGRKENLCNHKAQR